MNVRLKRAKELAGYAVQLTKEEGLPTMVRRGAGFSARKKAAAQSVQQPFWFSNRFRSQEMCIRDRYTSLPFRVKGLVT